jgi:hypothetical protein
MWSLGNTLKDLAKKGHLPEGFQPSQGIRSLFPAIQAGGISITLLQEYLYSHTGQVSTESISVQFQVSADGAGH